MKVSKAQAQANRARIVEAAATLFRERGYDGVGVAELMGAAGFTHGGFYKHFPSKADLMAETAASGFAKLEAAHPIDLAAFVQAYVCRDHRDGRGEGCTLAALCGDAARQPDPIRAEFAEGVERLLTQLTPPGDTPAEQAQARALAIDTLAHAVGALVLSRACPDEAPLANEILRVCRDTLLRGLAGAADAPASDPDPAD
ncbi:TetR family transcriptional regulator [Comamonas serinivorans]|uniref:TetR family transcriptional regulator n=1 Tax=Comamonas serinivorans TaxID=1082851 RepID=A0A1Y0EN35_9BURK|nr:TetR/AcrR family transcriptional regulator [Comamonas serinivorans]ARU04838.1 TetR family transcriptional regulator [Comamonas serinivorans]